MKLFAAFLFSLIALLAQGQNDVQHIEFRLVFEGQPLDLERNYFSRQLQDSIQFETVRFYVSDLVLLNEKGHPSKAIRPHHLVDAAKPQTLKVPYAATTDEVHQLRFLLGIDSLTNVSGAMGGDLDPTKGMYWAWQSGYVNLKIEGSSPVCPTRKNRFQFHIGGYLPPNAAAQTIDLQSKGHLSVVEVELGQCLTARDLREDFRIMDPSPAGVEFAKTFIHAFTIAP